MEVGKRNRMVVMRMVCAFFIFCFGVVFFAFSHLLHPSLFASSLPCLNTYTLSTQIKGTESPITHIFGVKFRSTLHAPGQKDSVLVEDWRALRLDIQVRCCVISLFL